MVLFGILVIVTGMLYGYLKPGKEDRIALLKKGLFIGVIFALILVGLAGLIGGGALMLFGSVVGAYVFVEVVILAVLFILGTFIGDWLEEKNKTNGSGKIRL